VPDDFGLIECANCGAPLLVHMDGRVEHSGAGVVELEAEPESEPPKSILEEPEFSLAEVLGDLETSEPAGESPPEPEHEGSFQFSEGPPTAQDLASPDLSDIARFGNSDASAREGSLRYKLFIVGIDTADVREAFRDAITDRKMMWDTEQILRSIKNGEVELQNISPVKAYILVSRLRNLPVRIRWEQYAVAQT
jgi:hypothetical protein